MFSFLAIILSTQVFVCVTRINIIDKGVQPLERNSIGLVLYINVENESYLQQYSVSSRRERCCLRVDINQMDCSSAELVGGNWLLKPKEKKTLLIVYPTVFQHDKVGVCTLVLLSKFATSTTITTRQVNIPFDTRIFGLPKYQNNNLFKNYFPIKKAHRCISSDDDTMNDCKPVNCEIKYGGNRSYFDSRMRRCVPAVPCLRKLSKSTPDVAYIPTGNICRDLEQPLSTAELYSLSVGANMIVPSERFKKSNVHVVCNCTTMSQFLRYGIDVLYGKHGESHACNEGKVALLAVCALVFTACLQLCLCVMAMVLVLKLREMWIDGSLRKNASSAAYYLMHFKKKRNESAQKRNDKLENEDQGVTKNLLLKEILTVSRDEELRKSASQLCERMSRQISSSRRYRNEDIGSQISLNQTKIHSGQKLQKEKQRK